MDTLVIDQILALQQYYDQLIRIQLQYRARSGRKTTQWRTPDFFVIRQSPANFEEWKPVTALDQLAVTMPERYHYELSGGWRYAPYTRPIPPTCAISTSQYVYYVGC